MAPKFGTSGLRGLVTELTGPLLRDHVLAFAHACPMGSGLFLGCDLRPSSAAISAVVAEAARAAGLSVTDCGAVPTPALAMAAMAEGAAAIMITGSHIPADRNGLKFYTPKGEITKADEAAILAALGSPAAPRPGPETRQNPFAGAAYVGRYVSAFGPEALKGMRLGLYSHSAVARDLMAAALRGCGAGVTELGRSETFIPVDTEAVEPRMRAQIAGWAAQGFDAILSADGDSDRPLLADASGRIVPGDVLGQITARVLGAEVVVTPVSSNSGAELGGAFARVIRTRIGSPYVIAAMEAAGGKVAGYEANGGFLLGFDAHGPAGRLPALMTRDALLPLIATLHAARGAGVAALVAAEPPRFTATGRLQEMPGERSHAFLARLAGSAAERSAFLAGLGEAEAGRDETDGLRLALASGRIVHLRPSGNAPEFRLYVEAETVAAAEDLLTRGLALLRAAV